MTKQQAIEPAGRMLAPISMGRRGVELATFEDAQRFAKAVVASGFAPKGMNEAGVIIAMQMGAELGLSPMASLQNIAVINGRPALWGDAMLAICRASGVFDEESFEEVVEDTGKGALKATCTVRRLPNGRPVVREFDLSDAKMAGLLGKSGPWSQYPKRMLQLRARSFALRDAFTDVLRGFDCAEEVRDIPKAQSLKARTVVEQLDELADAVESEFDAHPEPEFEEQEFNEPAGDDIEPDFELNPED